MDPVAELTLLLGAFVGVLVSCVFLQWRTRALTIGLPGAYLMSLFLIHGFGATAHLAPGFEKAQPEYMLIGFRESVIGAGCFLVGAFFITPFFSRRSVMPGGRVRIRYDVHPHFARLVLVSGVLFFSVIAPALARVPSLAAVSVAGVSLVIVGLCVGLWQAWQRSDFRAFALWISAICLLPVVTVITMGFIGYGAAAAMVVLAFVSVFFRPRWATLSAGLVLTYLGLSLYVSYMRDRNEIRDSVWSDESINSRTSTAAKTISDFEWFDPSSNEQLLRIDGRLNQNALVSAAVVYLGEGSQSFAHGRTIFDSFLAIIPRILWPGKPVVAGSGDWVSTYTGIAFAEGTSVGLGHVLELYINFGRASIIVGFLLLGIAVGIMDRGAAARLHSGDLPGFVCWFLPALALLQTGGSFVELTGTFASSLVLVFCLRHLPFMQARRQLTESGRQKIEQILRSNNERLQT